MKAQERMEQWAVSITLLSLAAVVFLPFLYEDLRMRQKEGVVITLTGVAEAGTWTQEQVSGWNYWRVDFPAARPVLRAGRPALLRLRSADVVHRFYAPSMGIGPVEVYPGHLVEVQVTPEAEGVHSYYCTTVCGDPHFSMRGKLVVDGVAGRENLVKEQPVYWKEPPPPPGAGRVAEGRWLYRRMGCVTCHGQEGKGGIPNFNYVKGEVPPLNTLAERLMLFYPEDVQAVVAELEKGRSLDSLAEDPPVPRFNVVLAQYRSVKAVICQGNPAGKKDPRGPEPPLQMLPWCQRLSPQQIDSIVAYLLTLQPWD